MRRRAWLVGLLAARAAAEIRSAAAMSFPRDHGAHLDARTEWWYATGWIGSADTPTHGFQLTFFRSRTGLAEHSPSRFAARQLLFAHAAVTELAGRRHLHAQRIARWSGDPTALPAHASTSDTDLRLLDWSLRRDAGSYRAELPAGRFAIELTLTPSEPQLAVQGSLTVEGRRVAAIGRAWLDREWSSSYLAPDAVGWDWIGFNLFDGSALMAFRIRRADGTTLWAGGSHRPPGAAARVFGPDELHFTPGRRWASPGSQARYPVQWQVQTPAGRFEVGALLDAQELDSRASTGAIYWEGLAELKDPGGRRVGLGYLEMTGYASRLQLGR